jgi:hypothetical protein
VCSSDLLCRPADLIHMAAHDCYPGRHTEHAWRESRLVGAMGRLETSINLLNAPEALIREGIAYVGERIMVPDDTFADLLVEMYGRGGLAVAANSAEAREAAEKQVRIEVALEDLRAVVPNAALLLHGHGAEREDVAAYLRRYLITGPDRAARQLALIEDPIGRAEVIAGNEGERLLRRWFGICPIGERVDRYGRLLREQITPRTITDDLTAFGFSPSGW